jgi:GGDEF domain-containing protein
MFGERLDHALRVGERGVAVVWIDLDDFKEVNDIFGHDVGDEMLVAVADRLREVVRETDDIARMGGDEFAVILPNVVEPKPKWWPSGFSALTDKDAFRLQMGASVGCGLAAPGRRRWTVGQARRRGDVPRKDRRRRPVDHVLAVTY